MTFKYANAATIITSVSLLMAGCGGAVFTDDIATGKVLWSGAKIGSYAYTVEPYGFMLPQKYDVLVYKDGTAVVTPLGDSPPTGPEPVFRSMNSLYAYLRNVRENHGQVTVQFDATDGHITECYVDPYRELADDDVTFRITQFRIIQ